MLTVLLLAKKAYAAPLFAAMVWLFRVAAVHKKIQYSSSKLLHPRGPTDFCPFGPRPLLRRVYVVSTSVCTQSSLVRVVVIGREGNNEFSSKGVWCGLTSQAEKATMNFRVQGISLVEFVFDIERKCAAELISSKFVCFACFGSEKVCKRRSEKERWNSQSGTPSLETQDRQ